MKKFSVFVLAISALLVGCETTQSNIPPETTGGEWYSVGKSSKSTPKKTPSNTYRIFQVIPKGALALKCDSEDDDSCYGITTYIPKTAVKKPYNGMKVTLLNAKVIDTYTYTTVDKTSATVPIVSGTMKKAKTEKQGIYRVFQVISEGALASKCSESGDSCYGIDVLIPKTVVKKPYDGMMITLSNPKVTNTFTYPTKNNSQNTVAIIKGRVSKTE